LSRFGAAQQLIITKMCNDSKQENPQNARAECQFKRAESQRLDIPGASGMLIPITPQDWTNNIQSRIAKEDPLQVTNLWRECEHR
jgi:hypothetical protein